MSPVSPKRHRLLDQATSIGWFDLPFEMREMVIDRMDPKTRCKFAQCSKWCEYEVKKSKNYLYKIGLTENRCMYSRLQLLLSHMDMYDGDYLFEFVDIGENQTKVLYKRENDLGEYKKWSKVESGRSEDVRWKYFNEYAEKYKHSIRTFVLNDSKTLLTDFNIKQLRNLEKLEIENLSIKNIKNIKNGGLNPVECGFIEMKQLIMLKHLILPSLKLTFDQVVQLEAKFIRVRAEDFSEENIKKYLKMIKKGEVHMNARSINIRLRPENKVGNIQNVLNGLDVFNYSELEHYLGHEDETRRRTSYMFNFNSDSKRERTFYAVLTPQLTISII